MNKLKKYFSLALMIALAGLSVQTFAQQRELDDAWFAIKNNDLARAKKAVDAAYEHETTKGTANMYYFRGLAYMQIAANEQTKDLDPEASYKSADAYYNYIISNDKKKKGEIKEVFNNILYSANFCLVDAEEFAQNEDYKKAIKYSEMAYKLTLHDELQLLKQNGIQTNKILLNMYIYAHNDGNVEESRKYLKMLVENKYDDPLIYIYLANSYFESGDDQEGLGYLEQGRELFPDDKDLLVSEINYYIGKNQSDKLLEKFNSAIEVDPNNANYYYYRGVLYHQDGKYDLAEQDYLKAIELDPYNIDANYNLGAMYIEQTKPIIEKMNKNVTNFTLYDELEAKQFELYEKASPYLETAYDSQTITDKEDKVNLLTILRDTYKFKKDAEKMRYFQQELDKARAE